MNMPSHRNAARWISELQEQGYCIIRDLVAKELVQGTAHDLAPDFERTPLSVGAFYGANTRRFHGLLARSPRVEAFVGHDLILEIVKTILGPHCDHVQLNLTQAIEIVPGGDAQPPHRDQDMWPLHVPDTEYLINVMWPFTPYRAENGATLLWPGSNHRQEDILLPEEDAIAAEMDPGDVLIFLGSTLHGGGANRTAATRRGMIISYSLGWLKPYELPWLAYPPEVARHFAPAVAALAGYKAHRPNLGTHEGRCPSYLLEPEIAGGRGAVDALLPQQEALIAAYRRGELTPDIVGSRSGEGLLVTGGLT
ncbi:phytanoyl-CoA dioxygenase [Sphingobium sp. LB126]|uniref:phytanoyl-CoA dioxygenase family protein n=1 Tax=Sphingobium sp. LB126 TaxID=1983755 RepID=UPI000C200941|nr:phytanoyl-CoA dioxygenase family protein [Sphingobium sp. LB126]PJG47058.1 phytanoyl-CoA dioxygenase [Sphingobium sp. LB126]